MDNDGNGTHVLCALPKATAATKQTHNLLSPVRNKGLGYSDKRSKSGGCDDGGGWGWGWGYPGPYYGDWGSSGGGKSSGYDGDNWGYSGPYNGGRAHGSTVPSGGAYSSGVASVPKLIQPVPLRVPKNFGSEPPAQKQASATNSSTSGDQGSSRPSSVEGSELVTKERGGQHRKKLDEQWDACFMELLDYRSEHGDCDVPWSQGKLGKWVSTQRRVYKKGKLSQDRIDRLLTIGFKWALIEAVPWETRYNELVRYKAKHGDCNVPFSQGKLGMWVKHQRAVYKADSLAQDRTDRLNGIGFNWARREAVQTVPWLTLFDELVQYKAKHGDCNVPRSQGKLGRWVDTQRYNYKKYKLSQDRIDRLNSIGFDWTPPRGRSRKSQDLPSRQEQSSMRNESVSLIRISTNEESVSAVAGKVGVKSNRFIKGEDPTSGPVLPLPAPSHNSSHNRGTECDDEDDEIGALI